MRTLYQTVTAKQELSWKGKLSIYHSISVPALSYARVLWAVTEKIRLSVEVAQSSDRDVSWALCIWGVFFWPMQPAGDLKLDPEHAGEIMYLIWPLIASRSPRKSKKTLLWTEISELPHHCNLTSKSDRNGYFRTPPHTHTHKQQRQIIPLFKYYLLFCLIFSWFQSFLFIPSFSFWTSFLSFHCFSLLLLYCVPVTKQHTDALRKFLFCSLTLPLTHSPPYFFSLISAISASLPRSLAVYLNL